MTIVASGLTVLHVRGVEEVLLRVVVGGGRDDDEVRVFISGSPVERRPQVQRLFGQVFFDVFVLDGRDLLVDLVNLFGDHVDGDHFVVLREQRGHAHADVSGSCYGDFHIWFLLDSSLNSE